jgi:hypothetical protein
MEQPSAVVVWRGVIGILFEHVTTVNTAAFLKLKDKSSLPFKHLWLSISGNSALPKETFVMRRLHPPVGWLIV